MSFNYLYEQSSDMEVLAKAGPFRFTVTPYVRQGFGGHMLPPFSYAQLERADAAVLFARVRAEDSPNGQEVFLVMENFRPATIREGSTGWLVELLAGMVKPGEDPEVAIKREFDEETKGLEIVPGTLRRVSSGFPSAGGCTELLTFFAADIRITDPKAAKIAGLADESEDTRRHLVTIEELAAGIANGSYQDVKISYMFHWWRSEQLNAKLDRIPRWVRTIFAAL